VKVNRFTTLGGALMLAAIAVFGTMFSYATHPAAAGESTPESTPTTCFVVGDFAPAQCPTVETPVKLKTHTPTSTATAAATDTAVPTSTSAPAPATPVPPTQTPSGGQEGAGVRPPNTGSGDGTATARDTWAMIAGGLLLAAGLGTFGFGLRRR
jgi:hypothetical protein